MEKKTKKEPWWKRRLEGDISKLRKDLSKISSWFRGEWKKKKEGEKRRLDGVYRLKAKGFGTAIE